MFHFFVGFIHIVICLALIFFILIQNNKGMGLSGAFGSAGASESVFGSSGGLNILVKITVGLSIIFACTSIALSFVPPSNPQGGIMADQTMQEGPRTLGDITGPGQQQAQQGAAPAQQPAVDGDEPAPSVNQNLTQPEPDLEGPGEGAD